MAATFATYARSKKSRPRELMMVLGLSKSVPITPASFSKTEFPGLPFPADLYALKEMERRSPLAKPAVTFASTPLYSARSPAGLLSRYRSSPNVRTS